MSAADNCYDNAIMESCCGTIKTDLPPEDDRTDAEAVRELRSCVNYYNFERLHSSLGYVRPAKLEAKSTTK